MGALPMPDFPSGARRDLLRALHDLHHRAGWRSLRTLARAAGCSPTTVSAAFSSPWWHNRKRADPYVFETTSGSALLLPVNPRTWAFVASAFFREPGSSRSVLRWRFGQPTRATARSASWFPSAASACCQLGSPAALHRVNSMATSN
jgi:hypothetical protein